MRTHAISWFEIAVNDLKRSRTFYEHVLGAELVPGSDENCTMLAFPFDERNGVGGALTHMDGCQPGVGGSIVYLDVNGDLDGALARVPAAGGRVRLDISPHGYIGIIEDPEGNVVGMHSTR